MFSKTEATSAHGNAKSVCSQSRCSVFISIMYDNVSSVRKIQTLWNMLICSFGKAVFKIPADQASVLTANND